MSRRIPLQRTAKCTRIVDLGGGRFRYTFERKLTTGFNSTPESEEFTLVLTDGTTCKVGDRVSFDINATVP